MLQSRKSLIGYTLTTSDGELGKVTDFYFDDRNWEVRYIRVETGNWLFGRKVLIYPYVVLSVDVDKGTLMIGMTKEEVRHSPNIETDLPVSIQMEIKLYNYYSLSSYGSAGMGFPTTDMIKSANDTPSENDEQAGHNTHLRSCGHVSGYMIKDQQAVIGTIEDFIFDTNKWKIPFVSIKPIGQSPFENGALATTKLIAIDWSSGTITVDDTSANMLQNLTFRESGLVTSDAEMN
ncbi:MAG: PRC-barrel domain containing protein, partial [Sphingobacteriales bacterium]